MHFIDFIYWPDVKHHHQSSHFLSELSLAVRHGTIQKGLPDINCKGSVTVLSEMVSRWLLDKIMNNKLWLILNLWDEMINDNRPCKDWAAVLKYSCSDTLKVVSVISGPNKNDHIHLIFPNNPLAARPISRLLKKNVFGENYIFDEIIICGIVLLTVKY